MSTIAVCVKWVDLHPEIDPLTGEVTLDDRRRGFSDSDEAALEVALRIAEARGADVVLASVAPAAAAGALEALAASGASRIVHVVSDRDEVSSAAVGAALAEALGDVDLVVTGDYSLDRGSGSVPSFLAHHLGRAQACGLTEVAADGRSGVRRLDGGRREHVSWDAAAVVSVEGSAARLRRAALTDLLAARALPRRTVPLDSLGGVPAGAPTVEAGPTEPLRPRARAFPAPHGERALSRIVELTGALVERTPPRRVEAAPADAAAEIVAQLRSWGYVD